jgi:hypothetical protein
MFFNFSPVAEKESGAFSLVSNLLLWHEFSLLFCKSYQKEMAWMGSLKNRDLFSHSFGG